MIKIILFTLFLSSNVSALSFQKTSTGTFEGSDEKVVPVGEAALAQAALGTFNMAQEAPRSPASVEDQKPTHVTEITGTFSK